MKMVSYFLINLCEQKWLNNLVFAQSDLCNKPNFIDQGQ